MSEKIECRELGIKDCDFTARGKTAGDVVEAMVEHLRAEHDIDMPDSDVIMAGEVGRESLEMTDPAVDLIVKRLTETLNIVPLEEPQVPTPAIDKLSSA